MIADLVVVDHELDEDAGVYRLTVVERTAIVEGGGLVLDPDTVGEPFTVLFDASDDRWAGVPPVEVKLRQLAAVRDAISDGAN